MSKAVKSPKPARKRQRRAAKPELRVTMRHARAVCQPGQGISCAAGIRAWFASHDLDFRTFITVGIPISVAEDIDDDFARRVCAVARQEADDGR